MNTFNQVYGALKANLTDNITVSVMDYGAKGDGTTDDTVAIQACLTQCAGQKILFPLGNYKISKTVYIKSGTTITGCGKASRIFLADNPTLDSAIWGDGYPLVYPYVTTDINAVNITVKDIFIEGNKTQYTNQLQVGLGIFDATKVIVENVIAESVNFFPAEGPVEAGVQWRTGWCIGVMRSDSIRIVGCSVNFGGYECMRLGPMATNITVDGNYIGKGWRTSIQTTWGCNNIKIINNTIIQGALLNCDTQAAITLHTRPEYPTYNVTIDNNYVDATVTTASPTYPGTIISFVDVYAYNIKITNNTLKSNNYGISIEGSDVTFANNRVDTIKSSCQIGGNNNIVTGNIIKSAYLTESTIIIKSIAVGLILEGNEITNTLGNGVTTETGSVSPVSICNNTINAKTCIVGLASTSYLIIKNNYLIASYRGIDITSVANIRCKSNYITCVDLGIYITGNTVESIKLLDNNVVSSSNHCIYFSQASSIIKDFLISRNKLITDATHDAVLVSGDVNYVSVLSNVMVGRYAVRFLTNIDNTIIKYNNVVDATSKILVVAGKINTVSDNLGIVTYATGTYDPASLADGEGVTTTLTLTGAVLGDLVSVSFDKDLAGITLTAYVSATNTISIRFQNESGGVVDLASGTLKVRLIK